MLWLNLHVLKDITMTNIKYAIFDVGQVIYPYTLAPVYELMKNKTQEPHIFNNKHTPYDYDYKPYMKGEMSDTEFAKELCFFCRVEYNQDTFNEINEALHQGCGERFAETQKAIKILKNNNIEVCLLSNALPILADTGKNIAKPQYTFTSYNLGLLKPDPEIYKTVKEKLGVEFNEIMFIDDKEKNVMSAKNLGIHGIVYKKETIVANINSLLSQPIYNAKER